MPSTKIPASTATTRTPASVLAAPTEVSRPVTAPAPTSTTAATAKRPASHDSRATGRASRWSR